MYILLDYSTSRTLTGLKRYTYGYMQMIELLRIFITVEFLITEREGE